MNGARTRRIAALAAALLLVLPAAARTDSVYYAKPGGKGIGSVTGTIVKENSSVVQIRTGDGKTLSIARADVYQIVRDTPPRTGNAAAPEAAPAPEAQAAPAPEVPAEAEAQSAVAPEAVPEPEVAVPAEVPAPAEDPFEALERRALLAGSDAAEADEERPASSRHYGFKGGMNSANLSADPTDLEDKDSLTSFAMGAWLGIPLAGKVSLQTEALYSVKGDSETAAGYTATTRVAYLDLPVLAKMKFLHGAALQPSLLFGPSVAINLAAKGKLTGEGTSVDEDMKNQVRPFDVGMVVGGGVDFAVGKHTYGLELRYSRGLTNAADDNANGTARNEVIAVMGSVGLQ